MKYRISLLLAVIFLALSGCANDPRADRPRLLTDEEARLGDLNWLDADTASLAAPGGMIKIELTSCGQVPQASKTPRLVIGEPACLLGAKREIHRID